VHFALKITSFNGFPESGHGESTHEGQLYRLFKPQDRVWMERGAIILLIFF